jgi:hypothetical protein
LRASDELLAETVFAAVVESQVLLHARAVLRHKSHEAAEMIAVSMTEDQAVDLRGIHVEKIGITQNDFGRIAEIEQVLRAGPSTARFQM